MELLFKAGVPKDQLSVTVLSGDAVSPQNIGATLQGIKGGPGEALFFYFSGHGAINVKEGGRYLALKTGNLFLDDLKRALQARQCGLTVVMIDTCAEYRSGKRSENPRKEFGSDRLHPALKQLLLQHRGWVFLAGCEPQTQAYRDSERGGLFTCMFCEQFMDDKGNWRLPPAGVKFYTWKLFFDRVRKQTDELFQAWSEAAVKGGFKIKQQHQYPEGDLQVTSAAGTASGGWVLGLAVVDNNGDGVKIKAVLPNTPAAKLGLEPDDVLLAINDQALKSTKDFAQAIDKSGGAVRLEVRDHRSKKVLVMKAQLTPAP